MNILLIGDACIDEYKYGVVERISPEGPVPIFQYSYTKTKDGMGANVANNLYKLGCEEVTKILSERSIKTRLVDIRTNQQIVRIDNDVPRNSVDLDRIPNLTHYDAIVISDYDKGFISYYDIQRIVGSTDVPIFVDTKKKDLARLKGCIVKVNETEANQATSICDNLIVTLGDRGTRYNNKVYPGIKTDVVDITGAGDTFFAALIYTHLLTKDIEQAIKFANAAGSITVEHHGVYAPTFEQINARMLKTNK